MGGREGMGKEGCSVALMGGWRLVEVYGAWFVFPFFCTFFYLGFFATFN